MAQIDRDLENFKKKYKEEIREALGDEGNQPIRTQDYLNFKQQYFPKNFSFYEKACNFSERLVKVTPDKKKVAALQESIEVCHLKITPTGVMSFAMVLPLAIIFGSLIFGFFLPYLISGSQAGLFFVFVGVITGLALMLPLQRIPHLLANSWRLKASNQMVLCVFYIVTYMRHTSNLELAIDFAAEHLSPPLSIDLKKIIWNIETEKYDNVKESLDNYLMGWRKWNMEFIESMHLIQSSLYENSEERRVNALDKALSVMLEETYEKMLHYAHNLKGPLTTLHMLGVILPILGLVILPLMVSFMPEVKWYHLFFFYNLALPAIVYYLARNILSTRPTGYGNTDITETNPEFKKYRNIILKAGNSELQVSPAWFSIIIFVILGIITLTPLMMWGLGGDCADWTMGQEGVLPRCDVEEEETIKYSLLDYRDEIDADDQKTGNKVGPYGIGATLLSLAAPLAFGLAIGLWFKSRSHNVIKIRRRAKKLEREFASALFQLGNRLGDGYPAEIAFQKVADVMEDTVSGQFFQHVSNNIQKLGMGVEKAIFDPHQGALASYPSNLIESSMKVLVESTKKGPLIASQALINVSEYIKQMHRVDERLRDLMADVISSMKSQISFLTPTISGIVIGITAMISQILGTLGEKLGSLGDGGGANLGGAGALMGMFGNGVPTYYFQIVVGLYVVQIIFILTILINGIENGSDKLSERHMLGTNLVRSTITYSLIAFIIMIAFAMVAGSIVNSVI